jgi:ribonuclease P protein component
LADFPIEHLRRRPDFLAAAKACTCARGAVSGQARPRDDGEAKVRVGFTATRRIGGSVERNRAKRRLREAARLCVPLHGLAGCDYVFIARGGTARRDWALLVQDMTGVLARLRNDIANRSGPPTAPTVPAAPAPGS